MNILSFTACIESENYCPNRFEDVPGDVSVACKEWFDNLKQQADLV